MIASQSSLVFVITGESFDKIDMALSYSLFP
jgi:hypothetical protein